MCEAIFNVLKKDYLNFPSCEENWKAIADDFDRLWNFPHCIGALDGKHIVMTAPANSGSLYYNYKGSHSIVLMGVADATYKFIYIDVGMNGRVSDGGVFRKTAFYQFISSDENSLPPPSSLPSRDKPTPYVLVADDAFALSSNLMKPYSAKNLGAMERIFNYRLSRARRVVENAFGILSARFRVFRSPILLGPSKTRKLTSACCALHNFLITRNSSKYLSATLVDRYTENGEIIDGDWRAIQHNNTWYNLPNHRSYITEECKAIREEFSQYFANEGEIDFQYKYI